MQKSIKAAIYFLCCIAYLTFSLPWYLDVLFVLTLTVVAIRSTWQDLATLLVSFVVIISVTQSIFGSQLFYREHEKWHRSGDNYATHVVDHINIPHGDLIAIDPSAPLSVVEPRQEEFVTDSRGFRNRADYSDQMTVMVGDSFVVANGSDQKDSLPEVLTNELAFPTYSLAFPGDPQDYENRAEKFLPAMVPGAMFAFMIFEGNDFVTDARWYGPNRYDRFRGRLIAKVFPFLTYPNIIFGLSRRGERVIGIDSQNINVVEVFHIGSKDVGFLKAYIDAAISPQAKYKMKADGKVLSHIRCVFFIPDKYRVYKEFINDGRTLPEPAAGLKALQGYYEPLGIPVVDLTSVLRQAARTELNHGRYVFWRDDTHWNGNGIRAVATVVKMSLEGR